MDFYTKITFFVVIIFIRQPTICSASNYEKLQQKNYDQISLDANNFPVLLQGFELCGRYDLQEFLDEKLQEIQTNQPRNNDYHEEICEEAINKAMNVFDQVGSVIDSAQNFIVSTLSQDENSAEKFYTMLEHIIDCKLDFNSGSSRSYYSYFYRTILYRATDKISQYCVQHIEFMYPVIHKYINNGDNHKSANDELLMKVIKKDNTRVMQFLIDVKYHIPSEQTLHYAIEHRAVKIISMLGIHVKIKKDPFGRNQLHQAVLDLDYQLSCALIAAKIDIHQDDDEGNSPLHYLAGQSVYYRKKVHGNFIYGDNLSKKKSLITLLVDAGANIYQKNGYGKTPLDIVTHKKLYDALLSTDSHEEEPNSICNCLSSLISLMTAKVKYE